MKSDNPSTQPKTEGTRQSPSDWWFWAGPKDYRVIGDEEKYSGIFIAIFMNLLVVGFFFWTIGRLECGADCLFPEMILYNNTGGEITLSLGNDEPVIVARESMGRVSQPMAYSFLRPKYHKSFRIRTKNRTWSYDVAEPPSGYEKRGSSRNEYRYQIEADGTIYILSPESGFPVQRLLPQPAGFPWLPHFG